MKLQRLAFFAEQGDNEAMQRILDKEEVIQKKNTFLQPLYRDLKSTIKHMTYTEEYKTLREYIRNRTLILNALPEGSQKAKEGLDALRNEYARLLQNQKARMDNNDGFRLQVMQKRLEDMFSLLGIWQQYVEIIYAAEGQIDLLQQVKEMGGEFNSPAHTGGLDDSHFS